MLESRLKRQLGAFRLELNLECRCRVTGLFGPSGCGKTTLLNCLAGVLRPDEGRIRFQSRIWFDSDRRIHVPARLRRVGYVFQDSVLFGHMNVAGNIRYGQGPHSGPRLEEVVEVLDIAHLLGRMPEGLSGGEQRRVAIARALLRGPALLLLDEPLTGLDAALAGRIIVYLKRVLDTFDIPAVYVSHSLSDIVYLCDEVAVLQGGRIMVQGPPTRIVGHRGVLNDRQLSELQNVFTARLVDRDAADQSFLCRIGDQHLLVYDAGADRQEELTLAVHACDIVLAAERPKRISARNALPAVVEAVTPVGAKVLVFLSAGVPLMVEVGRAAVEELGLRPGGRVFAIIKATAIRIL